MSKSDKYPSDVASSSGGDTSLATTPTTEVLPPEEKKKGPTIDDAVIFLLDQEMRRHLANGRASKAKKIEDLIHALGYKTVKEKEEEAEAKRVAALKDSTPSSEPAEADIV